MSFKCTSCNLYASRKSTCKYCGVFWCSHSGCKGSTGNVKQPATGTNSQCQACGKGYAIVSEPA